MALNRSNSADFTDVFRVYNYDTLADAPSPKQWFERNGDSPIWIAGNMYVSDGNSYNSSTATNPGNLTAVVATPNILAGVLTLDLNTANVFDVNQNQNITSIVINNPAPVGFVSTFTLYLNQDSIGGRATTFPASCRYPSDVQPVLNTTSNSTNVLVFKSIDGGATYMTIFEGALFSVVSLSDQANAILLANNGVQYDATDMTTLFQDVAGTIPVTLNDGSQTCALMKDNSGRNIHAIQSNISKRPTVVNRGGITALSFSGNKCMVSTSGILGSSIAYYSGFGIKFNSVTAGSFIAEFGASFTNTGGYLAALNATTFETSLQSGGSTATIHAMQHVAGAGTLNKAVVSKYADLTRLDKSQLLFNFNGLINTNGSHSNTETVSTGNFGNEVLNIGSRNQTSGFCDMDFYAGCIVPGQLTRDKMNILDKYINSKIAATGFVDQLITNTFTNNVVNNFSLSAGLIDRTTYFEPSCFSEHSLTTSASVIKINMVSNIFDLFPQYSNLSIFVNDVFYRKINAPVLGSSTYTLDLNANSKKLTFRTGLKSAPATNVPAKGCFLASIDLNNDRSVSITPFNNNLLFYGDSITAGGNATNAATDSYVAKIRAYRTAGTVSAECAGYRALFDDVGLASVNQSAFVTRLLQQNPARLWLAIGTNDYGLSKWTAVEFGTAYASLLDALHTASPGLVIYCQTPLVRSIETANSNGNTLPEYRTQIQTAVATRTSYCTYIDGTTLVTLANLADGTHPNDAGHTQYANAIKAIIGSS